MRSEETYRAARHRAGQHTPLRGEHPKTQDGLVNPWRPVPMQPPRSEPYYCKRPRIKFNTFTGAGVPEMVPYTDMRKQPRVYRKVSRG